MDIHADSPASSALPLTGLARLFLVQLYIWVCGAFCAHLFLNALLRETGPEGLFWSIAMLVLWVFGIALIVGLHTRASWAPARAGQFCIAATAFTVLVMARFMPVLLDMNVSIGGSYYNDFELYSLLLLPCCAINLPMLYAWWRYFTGSERIGRIFGSGLGNGNLPPLGVGLLQVMCGLFAVFYLFFLLSMCVSVDEAWGFKLFMAGMSAPSIVFPLILLALVSRRGSGRKTAAVVLLAWLITQLVWSHVFGFRLLGALGMQASAAYSFIYTLRSLPIGPMLCIFASGLLLWRFFTVKEEAAWFNASVRSGADAASLCAASLLYFIWGISGSVLINGSSFANAGDIAKFALVVVLCAVLSVLGIICLRARLAGKGTAGKITPVFFGLAALCFVAVFAAVLAGMKEKTHLFGFIAHSSLYYIAPICVAVFGLYFAFAGLPAVSAGTDGAPAGAGRSRLANMPPLLAFFAALGFSYLASAVVVRLIQFVLTLTRDMDDYTLGVGSDLGAELFLSIDFWLGCVCLALLYMNLKNRLPDINRLRALCVLLIACIISSLSNSIIGMLAHGSYYSSQYYISNMLLGPETQIACTSLVLLIFYAAHSKEVRAWREGGQYCRKDGQTCAKGEQDCNKDG